MTWRRMVVLSGLRTLGVSRWAVAMKIKRGFCCCRSCKSVFDSEADYILHLSCDGFCRGGADRVVRDIARKIMFSRRWM
jgi:hypothetical protein